MTPPFRSSSNRAAGKRPSRPAAGGRPSRPSASRPARPAAGARPSRPAAGRRVPSEAPRTKSPAASKQPLSRAGASAGAYHVSQPKIAIVTRQEDGVTLQDFLADRLKLSKRAAKAMIDARVVWINRKLVWMAQHALVAGDKVAFVVERNTGAKQDKSVEARPHIRILWQDDHYLAIDKPAGLLTQGVGSVEELIREQEHQPQIQAVHRLDRETSGVLLMAKDQEAMDAAIAMFKTHRVTKVYNAIAAGNIERESSTLNETLDGERAVTHLKRLQSNREASFLALRIETGRTHQIRLHLSGIRHPILGDRQYGVKVTDDPRVLSITRQMLHASELELPHPMFSGEHIKAHSPLPADFRAALKLFGLGKKR